MKAFFGIMRWKRHLRNRANNPPLQMKTSYASSSSRKYKEWSDAGNRRKNFRYFMNRSRICFLLFEALRSQIQQNQWIVFWTWSLELEAKLITKLELNLNQNQTRNKTEPILLSWTFERRFHCLVNMQEACFPTAQWKSKSSARFLV